MKRFKGTKGKWERIGSGVFVGEDIVAEVFDGVSKDGYPMNIKMMNANAQLISKAPELLERLIEIISWEEYIEDTGDYWDMWENELPKIKQLIKEATEQ